MAKDFDGTQHLVYSDSQDLLASATAMSVCVWFYHRDLANSDRVFEKWTGGDLNFLMQGVGSLTPKAYIGIGGSIQGQTQGVAMTDNAWNHIGMSWSSGNPLRIWQDGVNETSTSDITFTMASSPARDFCVGGDQTGSWDSDGAVAEAAIWTVDLGAREWLALAAGYSPLLVRPDALIFYDPLITDGTVHTDRIGGLAGTEGSALGNWPHPPIIYPRTPDLYLAAAAAPAGTIARQHYHHRHHNHAG